MALLSRALNAYRSSRFLRYSVPFLVFVVGGSFGLKEFASIRYDFRTGGEVSREELAALEKLKKPGKVTLESEYEKIQKLDIENWSNVRVPRPWEEGGTSTSSQGSMQQ